MVVMRTALACLAFVVGGFLAFAAFAYKGGRPIADLPTGVDTFANGTTINAAVLVGSLLGAGLLFLALGVFALYAGRQ
jgi:hypothetical protein